MKASRHRADLGLSVTLRGDPEDQALRRAAADGDFELVHRMLLVHPYDVDGNVADRIVRDLKAGRALP